MVLSNFAIAGLILHRRISPRTTRSCGSGYSCCRHLCMAVLMRSEPVVICCSQCSARTKIISAGHSSLLRPKGKGINTVSPKICCKSSDIVSTYDHRTLKTRLGVRSALFKQRTGGLVVRWVTTSEYPLLYVFEIFFVEVWCRLGCRGFCCGTF